MRTYRRNFIKKALNDSTKRSKESRDGVIWYVDSDSSCRVKIQGTDNLVTAHFPRNQKARPSWMRPGNAVRIIHRGGTRGYIEVAGQGRAIPQPSLGNALPNPGITGDGIIEGMLTTATEPPGNSVTITNGSYRINGIIYYFTGTGLGYVLMKDPATMTMGDYPVTKMGISLYYLDPAPAVGYFRYDILVIGNDQMIDYIKGGEVTSNPVMPDVPTNHILICSILRIGADTVVENSRIGMKWTTPKVTQVELVYDPDFYWDFGDDTPEMDIQIKIKDQYGHSISTVVYTRISLQKLFGTGKVWSESTGYHDTYVQQIITGSSYTFKYERNQLASPEIYPHLLFTLDSSPELYAEASDIVLYDDQGDPI